jgi:hypothetical protein
MRYRSPCTLCYHALIRIGGAIHDVESTRRCGSPARCPKQDTIAAEIQELALILAELAHVHDSLRPMSILASDSLVSYRRNESMSPSPQTQ